MTTLKNNSNIQADGIRDVYLNFGGNGSTSSMAANSTKIWERQPYRSGALMTSSTHASGSTTNKWSDFGGTFKIKAGLAQWQTTSTKSTTTNTLIGWGTSGGVQAASNGNLTSAIGALYDGTTTYTTSAKPFDHLDSGFDGNKWISFWGHLAVAAGISPVVYTGIICFEGSGAGTGDTDWTSCFHEFDLEDTSGNTAQLSLDYYGSTKTSGQLNRSSATVSSRYSRVVYEYSGTIMAFNNSTDNDYMKFIKFT